MSTEVMDHSTNQSSNNHNSISSIQNSHSITADFDTSKQQQQPIMMMHGVDDHEDPLLISQSLTYVTDDGGTLHSFHSAPLSTGTWVAIVIDVV